MAAHLSLYAAGERLVGIYVCRITEKGWVVEQSWERLPATARSPVGAEERQAFPVFFWDTDGASAVM